MKLQPQLKPKTKQKKNEKNIRKTQKQSQLTRYAIFSVNSLLQPTSSVQYA